MILDSIKYWPVERMRKQNQIAKRMHHNAAGDSSHVFFLIHI